MTRSFHTTRWTLVRNSHGDTEEARAALADLCAHYYEPVVAFLSREGRDRDEASDLAHDFFSKVLAGDFLGEAQQERGRFRSYLLGALKHFIANRRRDENREKRGGGVQHVELESNHGILWPEVEFDRRWAVSIIERSLALLQTEEEQSGRGGVFQIIRPWLASGEIRESQEVCATRADMSTGALKVAIHRLRKRFREIVRAEIASTLNDPADLDDEMRYLLAALSQGEPAPNEA
ncbi:RNA polymerase sigma factor [Luteolibacter soli]|uniref:ECF-type sigma factor n=1 Tax=Luteolibacter soli TaxID=3135280 RepID=A0ABU9AQI9_9BACT